MVYEPAPDTDRAFNPVFATCSESRIDILVGNKAGEFMGGGHYFLLNDGDAQFTVNTSTLPDRVESYEKYRAWTVDIADLDADGHADLIMGGDTEKRTDAPG